LQAQFEANLWKYHNNTIEKACVLPFNRAVEIQRLKVDSVNAQRKEQQEVQVGPKLYHKGQRWAELVANTQRLKGAIQVLETEVKDMKISIAKNNNDT